MLNELDFHPIDVGISVNNILCKSVINKEGEVDDDLVNDYRRLSNMKQLAESSKTLIMAQPDSNKEKD